MNELRPADDSPREPYERDSSGGNEIRRVRASLQAVFRQTGLQYADAPSDRHPDLRIGLRQICADARSAGLRAEELLVIIKDVWSGLPAGISRLPSVHGDERLNYVISTCVDEYYAPDTGEFGVSP